MCPGRSPSSPCPDLASSGDGLLFMKNMSILNPSWVPMHLPLFTRLPQASSVILWASWGQRLCGDQATSSPVQHLPRAWVQNIHQTLGKRQKNGAPSKYPHSLTNAPGEKSDERGSFPSPWRLNIIFLPSCSSVECQALACALCSASQCSGRR